MVAPVDFRPEEGKCDPEEGVYLHSGVAHTLEEVAGYVKRTHMVIYHPDFHPLPGFGHQYVGYALPGMVVLEYVILQVDIVASLAQVFLECVKFVVGVDKDLHGVALVESGSR